MKKLAIFSILLTLVMFGVAYAASTDTATAATTASTLDIVIKALTAALIAGLVGIAGTVIKLIVSKGNELTDAFWTYLKNLAKKIENERVTSRLNALVDILDTASDKLWTIAGKVEVGKDENGKFVVTNLNALKEEVHSGVQPELTNSTKDLAKQVGFDIEGYIKNRIATGLGKTVPVVL